MQEQPYHQSSCHEKQGYGKERIYLADNLIDRQHGGKDVVAENDECPHLGVATHGVQDFSRRIDKHRAHHDQQQNREDQHHGFGRIAQVFADKRRKSGTLITHGEHAHEIIVNGTGKDTTQHNPQIGHRTELGTHDGTKDRTGTGNVQELNHKDFPVGKDNVV